jgi:hypothetical protein
LQAEEILARDVLPAWAGRDARSITPTDVLDVLDKIVERGAPVMANRCASLLGLMFRFAVQRRIVASTPVQLLMPPGGTEKPRRRTLCARTLDISVVAHAGLQPPCSFELRVPLDRPLAPTHAMQVCAASDDLRPRSVDVVDDRPESRK